MFKNNIYNIYTIYIKYIYRNVIRYNIYTET